MLKLFNIALFAAAVVADETLEVSEEVLTWATQDPLVYKGGVGTGTDKAVFDLISADLIAAERATTTGNAPGSMWIEFYYKKPADIWEVHGNTYFETTWDTAKNCNFSFWWSASDDGSSMADGFQVNFDGTKKYIAYDAENADSLAYQEAFVGEDSNIAAGETTKNVDAQQDLSLNPVKSRKTCDDDNNCTWQAHWLRNYETGDVMDIQFVEGILSEFYLWGEYDCGNFSGQSNKHRVILGHLYETEETTDDELAEDSEETEDEEEGAAIQGVAYTASLAALTLYTLF